jgi:hypothetical protein
MNLQVLGFKGEISSVGDTLSQINSIKKDDEIYPLINVSIEWINSFLEMDGQNPVVCENKNELALSFSEFLEDVAPQYKENVVKAAEFIETKLEAEK